MGEVQEYDVKRQLKGALSSESIRQMLQEEFGTVSDEDGHLVASYGALERLECWLSDKKKVCVNTVSRSGVSNSEAAETIAKYNRFLLRVTGYSSKERRKKAMKTE